MTPSGDCLASFLPSRFRPPLAVSLACTHPQPSTSTPQPPVPRSHPVHAQLLLRRAAAVVWHRDLARLAAPLLHQDDAHRWGLQPRPVPHTAPRAATAHPRVAARRVADYASAVPLPGGRRRNPPRRPAYPRPPPPQSTACCWRRLAPSCSGGWRAASLQASCLPRSTLRLRTRSRRLGGWCSASVRLGRGCDLEPTAWGLAS